MTDDEHEAIPTVDARPVLAAGGEPLDAILSAAADVEPGAAFAVIAPFEPVPLVGLLGGQGFEADPRPLEGGDWRVVFRRAW
ncbi:MAG TPA: DUF2249 domain-containing protein [Acidimicrobiales bacterium]|nr:DUF2249 domain-containing protein [Acidimicrobiales bacterium]